MCKLKPTLRSLHHMYHLTKALHQILNIRPVVIFKWWNLWPWTQYGATHGTWPIRQIERPSSITRTNAQPPMLRSQVCIFFLPRRAKSCRLCALEQTCLWRALRRGELAAAGSSARRRGRNHHRPRLGTDGSATVAVAAIAAAAGVDRPREPGALVQLLVAPVSGAQHRKSLPVRLP